MGIGRRIEGNFGDETLVQCPQDRLLMGRGGVGVGDAWIKRFVLAGVSRWAGSTLLGVTPSGLKG